MVWSDTVDRKFETIFGQSSFLAHELSLVKGELGAEVFAPKVLETLSQSNFLASKIRDGVTAEILRLSDLMKIWVTEEVGKVSPNLETSMDQRFFDPRTWVEGSS